MTSRRRLTERNFRNQNRVEKSPSFVEPIENWDGLTRRPSRRTPEQKTIMKPKMKISYHDDDDDDDAKKKSGILKPPPLSVESKIMARDPQNQRYKPGRNEPPRCSAGRNLRWNDEDSETTGSSSGRKRPDGLDDFEKELSELARIKEEVRKTVQNRKSRRLGSDALVRESERVSAMTDKLNPTVQSCPDIRSVVDGLRKHDRNQTSIRSSKPLEALPSHCRKPPEAMTQHPSRIDCRKHPLLTHTALTSDAEEEQVSRRIRGHSLDPYEHIASDRRDASVPSRSRSQIRKRGHNRKAGPSLYDRRDQSLCTCRRCGAVGNESPDSRRERLLLQERWNTRVWQELHSLLQALPTTTTTTTTEGRREPRNHQSERSSSSNDAIFCCRTSRGKIAHHIGAGRGAGSTGGRGIVGKRGGGGPVYNKITQTEDSSTNLRAEVQTQRKITPSVELIFSHLRSPGEKDESRTADRGCQTAADHEELDVHNCDSSITETTSIWPSASASGTQRGSITGVAAATTSADDACHTQEHSSLLQSISAELVAMSVSAESLRAAIGATTGGQPLDENSVLEAIDREMADVNHFVKDTLDLSEIKPKEYIQMHMSILKKFTFSLEQFISKQKPTTNLASHVASTAM